MKNNKNNSQLSTQVEPESMTTCIKAVNKGKHTVEFLNSMKKSIILFEAHSDILKIRIVNPTINIRLNKNVQLISQQ